MAELITGRIYVVKSPNTKMVYVGGTITSLKMRFLKHLSDCRIDRKEASASKLILEKGNAYIELLEEVEVENVRELERLEQIWIDQTPNAVNKNKAFTSVEEKKKRVSNYSKKYYEANKEEISEKYREKILCEICDCYVARSGIRKHERTSKHIGNIEISS
jgi:hypothetical protein